MVGKLVQWGFFWCIAIIFWSYYLRYRFFLSLRDWNHQYSWHLVIFTSNDDSKHIWSENLLLTRFVVFILGFFLRANHQANSMISVCFPLLSFCHFINQKRKGGFQSTNIQLASASIYFKVFSKILTLRAVERLTLLVGQNN